MIHLFNQDCMEAMASMKDNQFDLAIVDPPYGIKASNVNTYSRKEQVIKTSYKPKTWDDSIPKKEYFDELKRVSKHQIICGGNYFTDFLNPTKSWIVWDKKQGDNTFSMFELIYCSFPIVPKIYSERPPANKNSVDDRVSFFRIHPTQKPVALYTWLLDKYAQKGWKILDTHLGSGSSAIAAHDMGFEFHGYELDTEYFEAASKRLKLHQQQMKLF